MRAEQSEQFVCDHCGRNDLGSHAAGIAVVKVPILNPHDHDDVTGYDVLTVCAPRAAYRPRCKTLVSTLWFRSKGEEARKERHGRNCGVCFEYNPPGTENQYGYREVAQPDPEELADSPDADELADVLV
jgi:hypothetical protein